MKRSPFEPIRYAEYLESTGNYASDNNLLYEWTGTHWNAIDDASGERVALKWIAADGRGTASPANAKAAYQTAVLWLPIIGEQTTSDIIPVQNGYLHLDHGLLLKHHDKALGLRHVLACVFDSDAPEPTEFKRFLTRILPDEAVRSRVQEYIGYTLLPDARYQRAQVWIGSGANGKGCLANVLQALHERTAAVQLDALDGFKMAGMIGASLIYCDEAPQRNINEQTIKSLIAGELVPIDRKYRDPISVRINGKWLILANHIPAVTDQSPGFWRRFDFVPFPVEIPENERDPLLAKRIIAGELAGVLRWALEGLTRLLARGRFSEDIPTSMRLAAQSARTETNSVHAWSIDCSIGLTTIIETPKSDVYSHYACWCRSNGMVPVASPKFWKRLSDSIGTILEGRTITTAGRIRTCNVQM